MQLFIISKGLSCYYGDLYVCILFFGYRRISLPQENTLKALTALFYTVWSYYIYCDFVNFHWFFETISLSMNSDGRHYFENEDHNLCKFTYVLISECRIINPDALLLNTFT